MQARVKLVHDRVTAGHGARWRRGSPGTSRMAARVRLAQAARPLGRAQGVDPPGENRRADAIERRAVVGSSASTSARRIDSRAVAISLASAQPESVSVTLRFAGRPSRGPA